MSQLGQRPGDVVKLHLENGEGKEGICIIDTLWVFEHASITLDFYLCSQPVLFVEMYGGPVIFHSKRLLWQMRESRQRQH